MTSPSSRSRDKPIRVTAHALARARQRHGDLRQLSERDLLRTMVREVGAAMRCERVAKTLPRETVTGQYTKRGKAKTERFAWNPGVTRVYVLRRTEGIHLVVTVLATTQSQA